jgi:hypothetical protein
MRTYGLRKAGWAFLLAASLGAPTHGFADSPPQASKSRIEAALDNILTLERPGQDGYATTWDGNKYVQCGRARARPALRSGRIADAAVARARAHPRAGRPARDARLAA